MLEGLVQHDHPLTLQHVLGRMRNVYGGSEVVTLTPDGTERASYAEVCARVDRLANALRSLGIEQGDRVATFAWNTQRHLEVYLAAPCTGAVLHTLNLRLFAEQLTYIANHAKDRVVFVDDSVVPLLEKVADTFETVEHYVLMGDGDGGSLPNVIRYEDLIADQPESFDYPELDDRAAAGLCYTSGTTGNPKGVLYSHRSQILHSFGTCLADAMGLRESDRVLPIVPMFHANSWGIPYAAGLTGCDLIMPAQFLQAEPLAKLIEEERVTVSAAVPTIWMDLLRHADENEVDLSSLRTVICGGAAVPLTLMQQFEERHGVHIVQAWGMTEMSPLGTVARPDERWTERPLACVVLAEGASATPKDLCEHLSSRVAKWWLPEEFAFIDEVPKTSVGKFDKKLLRQRLADGELDTRPVSDADRTPA
jgi:fatty-acyl-CoA synthase